MMPFLPLWVLLGAVRLAPAFSLGGPSQGADSPRAAGDSALVLGRNPGASPGEIARVRGQMLAFSRRAAGHAVSAVNATRGLEMMVRATWRRLPLDRELLARLAELAGDTGGDPRVRRHAFGALLTAQSADSTTLLSALGSRDEQLRRLAVTGLPGLAFPARGRALSRAAEDPSSMVRLEALRAAVRAEAAQACPRISRGTRDRVPQVALMSLDLLAGCAADSVAARVLLSAAEPAPGDRWHRSAHALVSLAQVSPEQAAVLLPAALSAGTWQTRMYAARAAATLRDRSALERLAADTHPNVQEAALTGLTRVAGHAADPIYRAALGAADHQLVLTAATALAGSPSRDAGAAALRGAFARVSAEGSETARDTRIALLVRLRELGAPADSAALLPALEDFDPVVADTAGAILSGWTGRPVVVAPRRLPPVEVPAEEVRALRGRRLRFTMASGGTFEVELLLNAAPQSVARIARLVRQGYYDGLTFHRVVPNFVVQGGSPGANEYAGTPRFMADELSDLSHERGTLGVSTRGRDTGDAQLFINLVDNPRLDYEYTVWGRVVTGMATVDAVLEGDLIRRVEIRPR